MKVRALATVTLPADTLLVLDPAQVRRRRQILVALGGASYRASAPVQFKAGEVFGVDSDIGEIGKAALAALDVLGLPPVTATGPGAQRRRGRAAQAAATIAAPANE